MNIKCTVRSLTLFTVMMLSVLPASLGGCASSRPALTQLGDAPGNDLAGDVQRTAWRFAGADGQIITTAHYQLYITLNDPQVIDGLLVFAEQGLTHYTSTLADLPMPTGRLETYLFQDRKQWEAKTRQLLSTQAPTFLNLGRGGFTTRGRSVLYYIDRHGRTTDTFAIVAHESWHQYAQSTLLHQLPIWLEEGIATYMEGYITEPDGRIKFRPWANRERYRTLRHAVRADKLIGLDEVITRSPQSFLEVSKDRLLIYYAQVWALVHFLHEGRSGQYRAALTQLLADAAHGRDAPRSSNIRQSAQGDQRHVPMRARMASILMRQYFSADLDTIQTQYTEFVRKLVDAGGYDRILEGRSPVAE